jgi:hypothetical protein
MVLSEQDLGMFQIHGEDNICSLLNIGDISQIDQRVEIVHADLEKALRDLYKQRSEFDRILFESPGKLSFFSFRTSWELPFELASVKRHKGYTCLANGLTLQLLNRESMNCYDLQIPVFRPILISGFGSNFCLNVKDAHSKEKNTIEVQLGRILNQISLKLEPEYNPDAESDEKMCYKPVSAWGYTLKR